MSGERDVRVRLAALAVAVAVLAVVVVVAVAGGGGERDASRAAAPSSSATPGAADRSADRELGRLVTPFRRKQASDDRLPPSFSTSLERRHDDQPGEAPSRSRRVRIPGGPAFVWPMSDGVCYASTGPLLGCFPTAVIRARGIAFGTSFSSGKREVQLFGIVRAGVSSVRLTLRGGRHIRLRVYDSAVRARLLSDPVKARWRTPDGRVHSQGNLVQRPKAEIGG